MTKEQNLEKRKKLLKQIDSLRKLEKSNVNKNEAAAASRKLDQLVKLHNDLAEQYRSYYNCQTCAHGITCKNRFKNKSGRCIDGYK